LGIAAESVRDRSAPVELDGSFNVRGIQPALYEVAVILPPTVSPHWHVRSIQVGEDDIRDRAITFDGGSIGGATIWLTDQLTGVVGTLTTGDGSPTKDYAVVLFPEDLSLWHPTTPRVAVAALDNSGAFRLNNLPEGRYRIAAVADIQENEWRTKSFLETIVGASLPVTITEGKVIRQDLRLR